MRPQTVSKIYVIVDLILLVFFMIIFPQYPGRVPCTGGSFYCVIAFLLMSRLMTVIVNTIANNISAAADA